MSQTTTLIIYCGLILLASLVGGWLPMLVKLTHQRMEIALSFVAGVMLGVGVLHLLPHAVMARAEMDSSGHGHVHIDHDGIHDLLAPPLIWLIVGFLAMFFIERFFSFHHHDAPDNDGHVNHDHHHHHGHRHGMTWAGAAIGLSLHSLIEGIALAASVAAMQHDGTIAWAGLATFLVIFLHKPFDAMTIGTLMSAGKRSSKSRHVVNLGFSLLIPVGVAVFYLGLNQSDSNALIVSSALAFAAGTFLCIALSDLLPELQFHHHDRGKLSLALILGLALAWGMAEMEARMHTHDHADEVPFVIPGS